MPMPFDSSAPPFAPWDAPAPLADVSASVFPISPALPVGAPAAPSVASVLPPHPAYVAPSLPTPQAFPPMSQPTRAQQIMRAILPILAAGLGPGAGTGLAQGTVTGEHANEQRRQQDWLRQVNAIKDREQQQRLVAEEQRRQYEFEEQQRQHDELRGQRLQTALESLRHSTAQLTDKSQYDAYVNAYATGLQGAGYRLDANFLRQASPFVAPKAENVAEKAVKRWLENPLNEKLLKEQPEQALTAKIPIDTDGDGVPESVTLERAADLARMPFTRDGNGRLVTSPKGVTTETRAGVDARFQDLLNVARSEGKDVDSNTADASQLRNSLRDQAYRETPRPPARVSDNGRRNRLDAQTTIRRELRGALIAGQPPDEIVRLSTSMQQLGLDPTAEIANVRKEFLTVGQKLQTPEERATFGTPLTPDALMERGRRALSGMPAPAPAHTPSATTTPTPAPAGNPTPQEARAARDVGRRLLEDARRKAGDPRPVSDADVDELIKKPGNFDLLRQQAAGEAGGANAPAVAPIAPGRYRYVPGQGLTPVPPVH